MATVSNNLPVAVIGAGPVGLAAAAHLVGRGVTPLVFEAGASVATHLESYRHVQLFSPWHMNMDAHAQRLLAAHGWTPPPPDRLPTAGQMIDDYLAPLSHLPSIAPSLHLNGRVLQVSRVGFDKVTTRGRDEAPFLLRVQTPHGIAEHRARAVIDASGTWGTPNPLGANGLPAVGEAALADRIAYGMPDVLGTARARYAGQRVLVVGAGHAAAGNLLALLRLAEEVPGTHVVWAVRRTHLARLFGGGAHDELPARGVLGARLAHLVASGHLDVQTGFRIRELRDRGQSIDVVGEAEGGEAARLTGITAIICATGARPDLALTRELRVQLDPWLESTAALAPLIDPNVHSCGTVPPHGYRELAHPEAGYYAVGAKSYGRAPNFLLATGYEQVRSVVAALAHDDEAANRVELTLPGTGECGVPFDTGDATVAQTPRACCGPGAESFITTLSVATSHADSSCCGGPAPAGTGACCVLDAQARAEGKEGCGCHDGTLVQLTTAPATAAAMIDAVKP
jgi:thioredoxin reductase